MQSLSRLRSLLLTLLGLGLVTGCPMPKNGVGKNNPLYQEAQSVSESDPRRAVKLLERALTGDPTLADAHRALGDLFYSGKGGIQNYASAIHHYEKYLALEPDSPWKGNIQDQIERAYLELARSGVMSVAVTETEIEAERLLNSALTEKEGLEDRVKELEAEVARLQSEIDSARGEPGASETSVEVAETTRGESRGNAESRTRGADRAPAVVTHTVNRGETFYSIGRKYGFTAAQMMAANPGVRPNSIRVGQRVRIPGASSATPRR